MKKIEIEESLEVETGGSLLTCKDDGYYLNGVKIMHLDPMAADGELYCLIADGEEYVIITTHHGEDVIWYLEDYEARRELKYSKTIL